MSCLESEGANDVDALSSIQHRKLAPPALSLCGREPDITKILFTWNESGREWIEFGAGFSNGSL